ncbi:hypothetical protein MPER_08062, partial [Moniliophthora perniciosa FA553]
IPFQYGTETFGFSSQVPNDQHHLTGILDTRAARLKHGVKAEHALELLYVYGAVPQAGGSPSDIALSVKMMDYWISFATVLDPNDGKGESRTSWPQYAASDASILELNANNVVAIPDNYRSDEIDFINSNPILFRH